LSLFQENFKTKGVQVDTYIKFEDN
jgi:hypothetical protein